MIFLFQFIRLFYAGKVLYVYKSNIDGPDLV